MRYEIVHDKVRMRDDPMRQWLVYVDDKLRAQCATQQQARDFVAIEKARKLPGNDAEARRSRLQGESPAPSLISKLSAPPSRRISGGRLADTASGTDPSDAGRPRLAEGDKTRTIMSVKEVAAKYKVSTSLLHQRGLKRKWK